MVPQTSLASPQYSPILIQSPQLPLPAAPSFYEFSSASQQRGAFQGRVGHTKQHPPEEAPPPGSVPRPGLQQEGGWCGGSGSPAAHDR